MGSKCCKKKKKVEIDYMADVEPDYSVVLTDGEPHKYYHHIFKIKPQPMEREQMIELTQKLNYTKEHFGYELLGTDDDADAQFAKDLLNMKMDQLDRLNYEKGVYGSIQGNIKSLIWIRK